MDTTNRVKRVHFQNPRPVIERAVGHIVPRHPSPPPREILSPSPSISPPTSPPTFTPIMSIDALGDHAETSVAGEAAREVRLDKDAIQIPISFPTQDLGVPTLGTTHLNEPPEGELPPPPPIPSCFERSPGFEDPTRGPIPPALHVHAYNKIQSVQRLSEIVNRSIKELSEVLFTQCYALENPAPA